MKSVVKELQMELLNHLVFHQFLLKTRRDIYVTAKRVCYDYYCWYVEISPNPGPQPSQSLKKFTRKRGCKILHQNINGISEKIDSVRGILQHKNIQILGFTEIHLNASVTDAEISGDGYKTERLDRKNGTHGGVICFI